MKDQASLWLTNRGVAEASKPALQTQSHMLACPPVKLRSSAANHRDPRLPIPVATAFPHTKTAIDAVRAEVKRSNGECSLARAVMTSSESFAGVDPSQCGQSARCVRASVMICCHCTHHPPTRVLDVSTAAPKPSHQHHHHHLLLYPLSYTIVFVFIC